MKKVIFFFILVALTGCFTRESVKDNTTVFSGYTYAIEKVTVDSIDYLIVRSHSSGGGIAIIKHK